jgi:hypothetical protein
MTWENMLAVMWLWGQKREYSYGMGKSVSCDVTMRTWENLLGKLWCNYEDKRKNTIMTWENLLAVMWLWGQKKEYNYEDMRESVSCDATMEDKA